MEEAPLIVRQSLNNNNDHNENCASCGQPLYDKHDKNTINPNHKNYNNNNSNYRSNSVSLNFIPQNTDNNKYNLKHLHDQCIKYGTGSYSRILSNSNTDTLKEEFTQLNNNINGTNSGTNNGSISGNINNNYNYNGNVLKTEGHAPTPTMKKIITEPKNLPTINNIRSVFTKDINNISNNNLNNNSNLNNKSFKKIKINSEEKEKEAIDDERRLNTMIETELDKITLKGDNLIRLTNKFHKEKKK